MHSLRGFVFLLVFLGALDLLVADEGTSLPQIMLTDEKNPEDRRIVVDVIRELADWKDDELKLAEWLRVYVGEKPKADQPAILGTYKITKRGLTFSPRFGFERGRTYSAKLSLPGQKPIWKVFELANDAPLVPAKITAVYPTGDKLPENLLRIYLHFSAPMSQGRSYQYLHLYEESGEEVESPFLTLPQELWTPDGKRLTVLLDPGRVKQGLKPREQSGPVLVPEKKYTFSIDESWPDAQGKPMEKGFQKVFETTKADIIQPNPDKWKIAPPESGTRDSFSVTFDEPLDSGMLERVLSVVDSKGNEVPGAIQIDQHETRWQFTPEKPWATGGYTLEIQTHLEDRVGNSIARPFEVDLSEPAPPKVPKVIVKPFAVGRGEDRR